MEIYQGLELDEADTNPFANTDGFYPVCSSFESHKPARIIRPKYDADIRPAYPYHS
jgi:hypothetical protein